jgi:hypothetical protein
LNLFSSKFKSYFNMSYDVFVMEMRSLSHANL